MTVSFPSFYTLRAVFLSAHEEDPRQGLINLVFDSACGLLGDLDSFQPGIDAGGLRRHLVASIVENLIRKFSGSDAYSRPAADADADAQTGRAEADGGAGADEPAAPSGVSDAEY